MFAFESVKNARFKIRPPTFKGSTVPGVIREQLETS